MNMTANASHRLAAFGLAAMLTLAMLGGVDFLATMDLPQGVIVASAAGLLA
jgi:hypothetical protein